MPIPGIVNRQAAIRAARANGLQVVDAASARLAEVGYSDPQLLGEITSALDKEAEANWGVLELAQEAGNEALAEEADEAMGRQLKLRRELINFLDEQRRGTGSTSTDG